jgi:hypothetical protein
VADDAGTIRQQMSLPVILESLTVIVDVAKHLQ